MILVLAACTNRAPVLVSLNDIEPNRDLAGNITSFTGIRIDPGETMKLEVEHRDPDGDAVTVHFSDMPGIVSFDPAGTRGTLEVFDDVMGDTGDWRYPEGLITLVDDHDPPGWSEVPFSYHYASVDTGIGEEHPAE